MNHIIIYNFILTFFISSFVKCKIVLPSLPLEHYQFWFKNNQRAKHQVEQLCSEQNYENIKFECK